jgi:hypothetical protein
MAYRWLASGPHRATPCPLEPVRARSPPRTPLLTPFSSRFASSSTAAAARRGAIATAAVELHRRTPQPLQFAPEALPRLTRPHCASNAVTIKGKGLSGHGFLARVHRCSPELRVRTAAPLRCFFRPPFACIRSALASRSHCAPRLASPWPRVAGTLLCRHGSQRACFHAPPVPSLAPTDALRRGPFAGDLTNSKGTPVNGGPCSGLADAWARLPHGSHVAAPLGALHRVHLAD